MKFSENCGLKSIISCGSLSACLKNSEGFLTALLGSAAKVGSSELVGGYDEPMGFYWLCTSATYRGREWHNLIRVSGSLRWNQIYGVIAEAVNDAMANGGMPVRVAARDVERAFEDVAKG